MKYARTIFALEYCAVIIMAWPDFVILQPAVSQIHNDEFYMSCIFLKNKTRMHVALARSLEWRCRIWGGGVRVTQVALLSASLEKHKLQSSRHFCASGSSKR